MHSTNERGGCEYQFFAIGLFTACQRRLSLGGSRMWLPGILVLLNGCWVSGVFLHPALVEAPRDRGFWVSRCQP